MRGGSIFVASMIKHSSINNTLMLPRRPFNARYRTHILSTGTVFSIRNINTHVRPLFESTIMTTSVLLLLGGTIGVILIIETSTQ